MMDINIITIERNTDFIGVENDGVIFDLFEGATESLRCEEVKNLCVDEFGLHCWVEFIAVRSKKLSGFLSVKDCIFIVFFFKSLCVIYHVSVSNGNSWTRFTVPKRKKHRLHIKMVFSLLLQGHPMPSSSTTWAGLLWFRDS